MALSMRQIRLFFRATGVRLVLSMCQICLVSSCDGSTPVYQCASYASFYMRREYACLQLTGRRQLAMRHRYGGQFLSDDCICKKGSEATNASIVCQSCRALKTQVQHTSASSLQLRASSLLYRLPYCWLRYISAGFTSTSPKSEMACV